MKKISAVLYSTIILLAIGGAVSSNAKASGKLFSIDVFRTGCADQTTVDCTTASNSKPVCTNNYGGTIGTVQVYGRRDDSNCDLTLHKLN